MLERKLFTTELNFSDADRLPHVSAVSISSEWETFPSEDIQTWCQSHLQQRERELQIIPGKETEYSTSNFPAVFFAKTNDVKLGKYNGCDGD